MGISPFLGGLNPCQNVGLNIEIGSSRRGREREGSPSTSLSFSVYLSLSISSHFLSISLQRPIPPTKYSPVTFLHQNQVIVSSKEGRVISEFGWMLRRNQVSQPTRCNISSQLDRTIRVAALLKREGLIYQIG